MINENPAVRMSKVEAVKTRSGQEATLPPNESVVRRNVLLQEIIETAAELRKFYDLQKENPSTANEASIEALSDVLKNLQDMLHAGDQMAEGGVTVVEADEMLNQLPS